MFRRRPPAGQRGPGLVGTMARTAVIAGTATATANKVDARHQAKQQAGMQQAAEQQTVAQLQQQMSDLQTQQLQAQLAAAQQGPAAAPQGGGDLTAQLAQLVQLQQSGALTQQEFDAAKAKLLGI